MNWIPKILPADVIIPSFTDTAESTIAGTTVSGSNSTSYEVLDRALDISTVIILLVILLAVAAIITIIVVAVRKSKKNKAENKETAEPTTDVWDE